MRVLLKGPRWLAQLLRFFSFLYKPKPAGETPQTGLVMGRGA